MEPVSIGVLSFVALTLFLVSGVRIAFATAMCGFFGLWILRGYDPAASLSARPSWATSSTTTCWCCRSSS